MKRLVKTILCIALAAVLCMTTASAVFAADAQSDVSIDDLLNLLSSLTGGSEEAEGTDTAEIPADSTEYTCGPVSFWLPSTWTQEDGEDGMLSFFPEDFSSYTTVLYQEGSPAETDLHNEANIDGLIESLGGEEGITKMDYVTVCGQPAINLAVALQEGDIDVTSTAIIIQTPEGLFSLAVASLLGDGYEGFEDIVKSISIDGASGITDLSAGQSAAPISTDTGAAPAPAAAAAEGIDATAVDEVVLVDNDVCTVTIKSFNDTDDYYAYTAKIFTENKTDINLYFTFEDVSVNGYMCSPWWGTSVSAGHKSNSELHFYKDDMAANGIESLRDMEFTLQVRDDDDWSAEYLVDEKFVVYPFGLDVPEQPAQEFGSDAVVLVDNDDCTMVIKGYSTNDYYFMANVYLENKTDKELEYRISGSSAVNGYEINPYFYKDVQPGKKMNTEISWYLSDLEENDIDVVEDLELELNIQDANDWYADPVFTDMIKVIVQ